MKKIHFLLAVAIVALVAACSDNSEYEQVISSYPDGSNQLVYIMKGKDAKAVKIGERLYYSNGQLQYEKHFSGKDETPDGVWKYYYPTGELFVRGDYKTNHEKGSDWTLLDHEGKSYMQGDYDSLQIAEWSELGTPASVIFHQGSTQYIYQFYSNCALRSSGKTIDGKRDGRWLFYHPNGMLQTEGTFVDGKENGKYTVYRDNGIPYYQGLYENGRRCGEWEFYDEEGNIAHRQKF